MLDINTITKIFSTGFTRETPYATSTSEITWDSLGTIANTSNYLNDDKTMNSNVLHQEYVTVLEKMFDSRANYYKTIESIAHTDKTLEIVDKLIDEILNAVNAKEPFTPMILETEPNAELALEACRELNYECDIYRYDRDLIKKLIIYGEYFLNTSIKPKYGITEINDMVEAKNILPLYKGYKIQEYLGFVKDFDDTEYIQPIGISNDKIRIDRNLLTHFAVSPNRYPLNDKTIPELIHKGYSTLVGVSVLYPALSRLYKLNQLDSAADLQALKQATQQFLIGVPVSSNVKPTDYPEIARTYVNFLQPIMNNNSVDINNFLSTLKNSGGFQVLPYPQGEGVPESIAMPQPDLSILKERLENLNDSIDKALGVDGTDDSSRSVIYAAKSRLVKRLQDVMDARRIGWKEVYLRHLLFKGIYVNPQNFDVQMVALPDYDVFAEAEGISHLITSMRDTFGFVQEVQQMNYAQSIDIQCLFNLWDSYVGTRYPVLKGIFGTPVDLKEPQQQFKEEEEEFTMEEPGRRSFDVNVRNSNFEVPTSNPDLDFDLETPEEETLNPIETTPTENIEVEQENVEEG